MLNRIEIQKKDGGVLTLPIYDATNFQIKDIQGLDPVKANIVTSNFAHIDGSQFQSSRREMRNIVIKLGIDSFGVGNTVQELRKELYSYFMPKSSVKIKFVRDLLSSLVINGQVESFESSMFVKEPEATISILCFDPDLYSENVITNSGTTVSGVTDTDIYYDGDVDSGFIFRMTANTSMDSFTIQNTLSDGSTRKLIFDSPLFPILPDNIITISTIPGDKYVRINRSGTTTSILWAMDPASDWVNLYPGNNKIRVNSSVINTPYTIEYNSRFGGL
jgi:hypothetical protein